MSSQTVMPISWSWKVTNTVYYHRTIITCCTCMFWVGLWMWGTSFHVVAYTRSLHGGRWGWVTECAIYKAFPISYNRRNAKLAFFSGSLYVGLHHRFHMLSMQVPLRGLSSVAQHFSTLKEMSVFITIIASSYVHILVISEWNGIRIIQGSLQHDLHGLGWHGRESTRVSQVQHY